MKKIYGCLILLVVIVIFSGTVVNAKTQKKRLITLEETRNLAVSINYTKEEPAVHFVSPDGNKYSEKNADKRGMQLERGEKFITFYIRNAKAGRWMIVYDKINNEELGVNCAPFTDALSINSLSAKKSGNDSLKVKFECSYPEKRQYDYEIFAAIKENGQVSGTKLLGSGTADTNRSQEAKVPLSILSSYDSYYVQLHVKMDVNGLEAWDEKVTDKTFSYTNKEAPEKITDCFFVVDVLGGKLLFDWSNFEISADEFVLAVYKEKEKNPVYSQTIDGSSDNKSGAFQIDMDWDSVSARIAYKKGGITSQIYKKEIPLKTNKYQVTFQTEEYTNSRQIVVLYDVPQETKLLMDINDNEETTMVEGKNILSYNLPAYSNNCKLYYQVSDNLRYLLEKNITVDSTAPIFNLYEDYSDIKTKNRNFNIVGTTETDTKLYVNNKEYEIDDAGSFSVPVDLIFGENIFEIKVEDAAGNTSQKTVMITRITDSKFFKGINLNKVLRWVPMMCSFVGSIVVSLFLILFYQHKKKKSPESPKRNIRLIHSIIMVILLICMIAGEVALIHKVIYYFRLINGHGYYDLVKDSIEQAYLAKESLLKYIVLLVGAFIITIVLFLLLIRNMCFLRLHSDDLNQRKGGFKIRLSRKKVQTKQFCKYCGKELGVSSEYCSYCGRKQT